MTRRSGFESLKTWPISKINPPETKPWYFILDQFMNWGPLLSDLTSSDWRLRTRIQPSLQVPRPDNFLLLRAPARCAQRFDDLVEGRNPWIWKTSHLLRRTSSCWQNFHWFIILIGCWFHPQTLGYHGKAPPATSLSIISPTTIDHRDIMIRHDTSTINPSYPAVIKHGTWTSPIYNLFSQL